MAERRKRNIIIFSLCGVLLLMVVGYAAFATQLNINGTTSITSNWDIKITNITSKDIVGKATDEGSQVVDDLSATFKVNLVSPDDSITYEITVENNGNIDAELANIKVTKNTNSAIKFETNGIEEGEILTANGGTDILTIKVTYSNEVTKQPDNLEANLKVTLDYVQTGHTDEWIQDNTITSADLITNIAEDGDGLYNDPVEADRYVYAGENPNNYITFNNEEWRILAIEADGTMKIWKILFDKGYRRFDSAGARTKDYCGMADAPINGCNVFAKTNNYTSADGRYTGAVEQDSEIKIYLNGTYYNELVANKTAIQAHTFYYGSVMHLSNDLATMISQEKNAKTEEINIGLIQPSDFLKTNTNIAKCNTWKLSVDNYELCKTTTWMDVSRGFYNTISPNGIYTRDVILINSNTMMWSGYAKNTGFVAPAIYLKSDTRLTGTGTQIDPYTIENYKE